MTEADTSEPTIEVTEERDRSRYVITVDGQVAGFTVYGYRAGRHFFVHTEIDDHFTGRGLATTLAREALDDVRAQGGRILPLCPFIAEFVERNPEYRDLVDADLMARIEDGRV